MSTERLVRQALEDSIKDLTCPEPDLEQLVAAGRAMRRRRVGVVASLAAAAVLVLVLAGLSFAWAGRSGRALEPVPAKPTTSVSIGSLGSLAYGIGGDIYVADADGRNPVRIADGAPSKDGFCGGYWGEGPIWSPDGRYLAFRGDGGEAEPGKCDRTITIIDSAGRPVASFPGDGWAIVWSPDSTRVAAWVDFYGEAKIAIHTLDGVRQALLKMPAGWAASGDYDPVWSPDGASLLVHGGVEGRGGVEVPVDGSAPRVLPEDDPRSQPMFAYSPNGAEIAYISTDGLGVAAADGSHARVLVPGALDEDFPILPFSLVWSPTGDRIAFVRATGESREAGPATELAVLDVASGTVMSLAEMGGAYGIEFSPEGDQILFTRTTAADVRSLWSVRADGSDPHQLVGSTGWGDWQTLTTTR